MTTCELEPNTRHLIRGSDIQRFITIMEGRDSHDNVSIDYLATATEDLTLYGSQHVSANAATGGVTMRRVLSHDTRRIPSEGDIVQAFLDSVYELANGEKPRRANKLLFETIDGWLRRGEMSRVNALIEQIDPNRLPADVIAAPLAVTLPAKPKLNSESRVGYVRRARKRLAELLNQSRANALMARFG